RFDGRGRPARLDGADAVCVVLRPAVRKIVPIHGREYDVPEAHELDCVRDVLRLLRIEPAVWVPCIDRAEAARPGTYRAHQHDRASPGVPAFADVRALGFLAHRGEAMLPHDALHRRVALAGRRPRAQPGGLAHEPGCGVGVARLDAVPDRRKTLRGYVFLAT